MAAGRGAAARARPGGHGWACPSTSWPSATAGADLLLNISGILTDERLLEPIPVRAYLDLDPAFNQLWQATGHRHALRRATRTSSPSARRSARRPARCPTLRPRLDPDASRPSCSTSWPVAGGPGGRVHHDRQLARLRLGRARTASTTGRRPTRCATSSTCPARADARFRLALGIHPDEAPDLEALRPQRLAAARPGSRWPGTPDDYRRVHPRLAGGARRRQERLRRSRAAAGSAIAAPATWPRAGRWSRRRPASSALPADRRGPARVQRHRRAPRRRSRPSSATTPPRARGARPRRGAPRLRRGARPAARRGSEPRERRATCAARRSSACSAEHFGSRPARRGAERAAVRLPDELPARGARRRARRTATRLRMMLKDLSRDALSRRGRARAKPAFLHDPAARDRDLPRAARARRARDAGVLRREHRSRPRPLLALHRERRGRRAVAGRRARDLGRGGALAGRLHARFAGRAPRAATADHLLRYDRALLRGCWMERARSPSRATRRRAGTTMERDEWLAGALRARSSSGSRRLPATFIHGEFYPSNVLVGPPPGAAAICPIDWEVAAVGPGLVDLAALTTGWAAPEQRRDRGRLPRAHEPPTARPAPSAKRWRHAGCTWRSSGWAGSRPGRRRRSTAATGWPKPSAEAAAGLA